MKIYCNILLFLHVTFILFDFTSAIKCYICGIDEDKCNDPLKQPIDDSLDRQDCDIEAIPAAPGNITVGGIASTVAATTAAPPARLIERVEASTPMGKGGIGCIKLVGEKEGKKVTVRACGAAGCEITKTMMSMANSTCEFCQEDLCNLSVQINSIGWVNILLTATAYVILQQ